METQCATTQTNTNTMKGIQKTAILMLIAIFCVNISKAAISEEEISKGVLQIDEKRYDEAYKFFTNFITDNQKNAIGYYFRSQAALGKGDKATALNDINTAIKLGGGFMKRKDVKKEDLLIQRSNVYKAMGDYQHAIGDLDAALIENPTCIDALICRGKIYADQKQYDLSDNDFSQTLTIDETSLEASMGLISNKLSKNELQEAVNMLNKLDKLYPETNEIYKLRGDAYVMMGKYKEAFDDELVRIEFQEDYSAAMPQLVSRAIQCDVYSLPKISSKIAKGENVELWLQSRAAIYRQLDRVDEAIADYDQLENILKESYAPICIGRGDCYKKKGDYDKAKSNYKKAIELESSAIAYARLGQIAQNEGKIDSAMIFANKSINLDPQNEELYLIKGSIQEFKNDLIGAQKSYETGYTLNRKNTALAYSLGRLKRDKSMFTNVTIDEKVSLPEGNYRQMAYHRLGNDNEAISAQEKILQKFETSQNYYDAAVLYAEIGNNQKAMDMLQKSISNGFGEKSIINNEKSFADLRKEKEWNEFAKLNDLMADKPVAAKDTMRKDSAANANMPIIPCTVDGMKLTFTTNNDTARIFTISILDVQMLLKYGYMQKNDLVEQRESKLNLSAIKEGDHVVLRSFKWGKKELKDVTATVVEDINAPILITQGELNEVDK